VRELLNLTLVMNSREGRVMLSSLYGRIETQLISILLDPGSQRLYIKKDVDQCMRYRPTGEEELIHGFFGGEMTRPHRHLCYKIHLQSLDNQYACNFEPLNEAEICSRVPVLQPGSWLSEFRERGIDVLVEDERPIEVLIEADIYAKLLTGRREILQCGLVATETYLGWIVTGKMQSCIKASSMKVLSMFVHSESEQVVGFKTPVGERVMKRQKLRFKHIS